MTTVARAAQALPPESERQFQGAVVKLARLLGWRVYHTHDSRRSAAGFPDLVLCRQPRLILAELKTDKGKVTDAQQAWLDDLRACGQDAYVWRPSDWPEITRVLKATP